MHTTMKRRVLSGVAAFTLAAGATGSVCTMPGKAQASDDNNREGDAVARSAAESPRAATVAQGIFSYSQQSALATAQEIAALFKDSATRCASGNHEEAFEDPLPESAADWKIEVTGAVRNAFTADFGALAEAGADVKVIGCACGASEDGAVRAAKAEVSGVSVQRLLATAVPTAEANAVTFIGADGTRATLPLWYLFARSAVLASEIAGEPTEVAMGATVQLWVDGAPGWCFVKDVTAIEVSCEDEPPAAPDAVSEFAA